MSKIPTKQTSTSPSKVVVFRPRQNTAAGFQQRKSLNFPLKIGDRVVTNGKSGTVAFIGQTRFAEGEWIGINLDEALGKNDGSYGGHRYFETNPNHGIFCRPDAVQHLSVNSAPQRKTVHDPTRLSYFGTTTNSAVQNPKPEKIDIKIGDRVLASGTRKGTVKYIGPTHIKEGIWCGIQLDQPDGKHDGKMDGKRYFQCAPRYGLLAPINRIEKIAANPGGVRQSLMSTNLNNQLLDSSSHTSILSELSSSSNDMPLKPSKKTRQLSLSTDLTAMETNLSSQVAELHEIIKEKDMFIKQLQQQKIEREKYEISKMNSLENQLVELEHLCQKKENENEKLLKEQLEMMEKIEDLQYQLEEYELCDNHSTNQLIIPDDHRLLSNDQIRIYEKAIEKIQELEFLNQKLIQENNEKMKSLQLELEDRKKNEQFHIEKELRFQQQIQDYQLKIDQLNQIQDDMHLQLNAISHPQQSELDFYKQQIEEYQTNINQAKFEFEQIRQELKSLQNENSLKEKQIETFKHNYEQLQIQLTNRAQELDLTLNEYQTNYEQNVIRATEETERLRVQFEEEKQINSLKDEYEKSKDQTIEKLRNDCEEYQREIKELIERECKANKTLHQREAQIDDYRERLTQVDKQNSQESESKIEQFLLENQSLHNRLRLLEEENLSKENQLNNFRQISQEQIDNLEKLQSQIEEFELFKQKYDDLQTQFEQERQRTANLQTKDIELSNTINSLTLELESLKIEFINREQNHQLTLKTYEQLQDELKQKEKLIYKECRSQCEKEIDEYQKGLELSIQRISDLQSQLANIQEEKDLDEKNFQEKFDLFKIDYEKQIENLRKKNQNLEKEYENINEQLKDYQSTYEQTGNLYHQIEDLTHKNKRLTSELEQLANSNELDELTRQLNQLQEMHKNLLEKHANCEEKYRNEIDEREKQIQEKIDDYEMKIALIKSEYMVEMENTKLDHDQEILKLKGQIPKTQATVQKGKK